MSGLHKNITLSFLVVGHTKFAPDWCFGLLKQRYRKTKVGSLADIAQVVNESARVNIPQLCGTEDGSIIVPTYDWKGWLATKFKTIPQMKQYHHFRVSADNPGSVFLKVHSDTEEKKFDLIKDPLWLPSASELPSLVEPRGLPPDRQWYLYEHIREFCPDYSKDTVAPLPTIPKPSTRKSPPPSSPCLEQQKGTTSAPVSEKKGTIDILCSFSTILNLL